MKYLILLLLITSVYAADLSKPYIPTRIEWLKQSIQRDIKRSVNLWRTRIYSSILINNKKQSILIGLTQTNDDEPISDKEKINHANWVCSSARRTISQYSWADKLSVTCLFDGLGDI